MFRNKSSCAMRGGEGKKEFLGFARHTIEWEKEANKFPSRLHRMIRRWWNGRCRDFFRVTTCREKSGLNAHGTKNPFSPIHQEKIIIILMVASYRRPRKLVPREIYLFSFFDSASCRSWRRNRGVAERLITSATCRNPFFVGQLQPQMASRPHTLTGN